MKALFILALLAMLALLGGCAQAVEPAPVGARVAAAGAGVADYQLGVADKVRVIVFNEPKLSGEFTVNANGALSLPLIGDVVGAGRTTSQIRDEMQRRYASGYLREPRVSIDVLTFRPFYILGEVNKPGEYPYSVGLTVFNAVATAQGFTYRANRRRVFIKAKNATGELAFPLDAGTPVQPGDTIRIGERYF